MMRTRWILPAAAGLLLIAGSAPTLSAGQRPGVWRQQNVRRGEIAERADQIADRARQLHRSGRLSRDHYDRTLAKLDRRWEVSSDRRVNPDRFRADMRYLDQVENTLNEWSNADERGGRWRPRR
jgi:hypothetical protein